VNLVMDAFSTRFTTWPTDARPARSIRRRAGVSDARDENLHDLHLETNPLLSIEFAFWLRLNSFGSFRTTCLVSSSIPRGERMASRRRGKGRRKVGRKKRRMRSRIRHRKK
jgi:hypothetical protein